MTRVNVGIPPRDLHQKHLMAEHREIKRIPNMVVAGRANLSNIPKAFCLGPGHVSFFYDKLLYLHKRYAEVYQECINRGYNVQWYGDAWLGVPDKLMNDWEPTESDINLIKQRINERLQSITGGPT